MRAIAKMAMRSPAAASINAAAYAVFALFFAPFMVVSGAILALSTLRFGATAGLRTFAVAMLIGGSGYYILLHRPQLVFLFRRIGWRVFRASVTRWRPRAVQYLS